MRLLGLTFQAASNARWQHEHDLRKGRGKRQHALCILLCRKGSGLVSVSLIISVQPN